MALKRPKLISDDAWLYLTQYPNEYNSNGYNEFGFGRDGYNQWGWDPKGFNKEGIHFTDIELSPKERMERQILYGDDMSPRYNQKGFNKRGYDRDGYDRDGYHFDGFNRKGLNKEGRDREGRDRDGLTLAEREYLEKTHPEELAIYLRKLREIAADEADAEQKRNLELRQYLPEPVLELMAGMLVGRGFHALAQEIFKIAREISEENKAPPPPPKPFKTPNL